MTEQVAPVEAPVEAPDPFKGGEPSFEEFSKYRETGDLPERFKTPTDEQQKEAPVAPKEAKTEDAKEAPKETEQEKQERERDDKGKFAKKVEFTPEQQEAFDRAFRKREAKIRREFEQRYAAQTSAPQATAAETKPKTVADANAEPQRPEPPRLSTYQGTLDEYEKEVEEYPAKLAAFLDSQRAHNDRITTITKRLDDSEKKAIKAHPDYKEEFQSLSDDIKNNEEPTLPPHVLRAIAEEAEDPHELTYYLAKNREEFRRVAELRPEQVLREVLKLDFKLAAEKDHPAPEKPQAAAKPKPPEPVGARATATAFDVNDEKLDPEEWARQRNEQVQKRRGR